MRFLGLLDSCHWLDVSVLSICYDRHTAPDDVACKATIVTSDAVANMCCNL